MLTSWARGGQLGRRGKGYQVYQPFHYQCSDHCIKHGSCRVRAVK